MRHFYIVIVFLTLTKTSSNAVTQNIFFIYALYHVIKMLLVEGN